MAKITANLKRNTFLPEYFAYSSVKSCSLRVSKSIAVSAPEAKDEPKLPIIYPAKIH
jgi:hypothetical protein